MVGKKPEKKPFGRDGPPKGYPKDRSVYADPQNWRYPLHTPWHAKAARRYFDEWSNRGKYTKQEQAYIDSRIDEALNKFAARSGSTGAKRTPPKAPARRPVEQLTLRELLQIFLGTARLSRVREIDDSLVSITETTQGAIVGKVKDYVVRIDQKNHIILRDCPDWQKNMQSKNMCKHLGKFLTTLDHEKSTRILWDILRNKEQWTFVAP